MASIKSARSAESIKEPGRHSAGSGLYLVVTPSSSKAWVLRYQLNARRTDMGLGAYPIVGLSEARAAAETAKRHLSQKIDPIKARNDARMASKPLPTFSEIAERVIEAIGRQSTNEKVRYQAKLRLGKNYCAQFLAKPVNTITAADVAKLLNTVRATKPETARKLHSLLAKVFETARVILRDQHGVTLGEMPTNLKDLKALGYDPRIESNRYPALDWHDAPAFMTAVRKRVGITYRALELAALSGLREGSVAEAQWSEIDLKTKVWTIPIERLKDKRTRKNPLRVPLSTQSIEIIMGLHGGSDLWLFPGRKSTKPIVPQSLLEALHRMNKSEKREPIWVDPESKRRIVVHGFRSTLRTWAEDHGFRREAAEESLGHKVGNEVESRYRRTDILEERRKLMDAWAAYCGSAKADGKVIPIRAKK